MISNHPYSISSRRTAGALAALSVGILAACGGGGGDETTRSTTLQAQIDTNATCAPNVGTTSTQGVVPKKYCNTYNDEPPSGLDPDAAPYTPVCEQFYPNQGVLEVRRNNNGAFEYSPGASAAWLTSWLSLAEESGAALGDPTKTQHWLTWSESSPEYRVVGAFIKNASSSHWYDYSSTTLTSDSRVYPPEPGAAIFWYSVCLLPVKPVVVKPAEWCSPGYWKNHTEAWTLSQDLKYTSYYSASTLSIKTNGRDCSGANEGASIFEVISKPQCYGGEASNLVADLLSKEKGLNFTGERVENCPLN